MPSGLSYNYDPLQSKLSVKDSSNYINKVTGKYLYLQVITKHCSTASLFLDNVCRWSTLFVYEIVERCTSVVCACQCNISLTHTMIYYILFVRSMSQIL